MIRKHQQTRHKVDQHRVIEQLDGGECQILIKMRSLLEVADEQRFVCPVHNNKVQECYRV